MKSTKSVLARGLTSMKRPAPDPKPMPTEAICCGDEEKYPYGLRIDMNNDSLKALKLKASEFTVGTEVEVVAKCKVISVSSRESHREGGDKTTNDSVDLQITEMHLQNEKGE